MEIGLSQYELAKSVGVTKQFISSIEKGIDSLSLRTVIKMSKIFNCTLDELIK